MAKHLDLEEQEQLDQLKHFWNQWGTPITAVLVLVLGSFAVWNGWQLWQQRQAAQAAALADAVAVAVQAQDADRMVLAFDTLKKDYASTVQASQAALQVAKSAQSAGKPDVAKAALQWAIDHGSDAGYQATAKLRLAALQIESKELDAAVAVLQGSFPAEFKPLAQDRLGDALQLQGKTQEAAAAYQQAWQQLDDRLEYRALVGYKLNALGVATTPSAVANTNNTNTTTTKESQS